MHPQDLKKHEEHHNSYFRFLKRNSYKKKQLLLRNYSILSPLARKKRTLKKMIHRLNQLVSNFCFLVLIKTLDLSPVLLQYNNLITNIRPVNTGFLWAKPAGSLCFFLLIVSDCVPCFTLAWFVCQFNHFLIKEAKILSKPWLSKQSNQTPSCCFKIKSHLRHHIFHRSSICVSEDTKTKSI